MVDKIDSEQIIQARVRGWPIRQIAKHIGCSEDDVQDVLNVWTRKTIHANLRSNTLALELERLDEMHRVLEKQAKQGDVPSINAIVKIIERRSILLGIAAPPRVDPQIIELQVAPPQVTSTERIHALIDRIRALPPPADEQAN